LHFQYCILSVVCEVYHLFVSFRLHYYLLTCTAMNGEKLSVWMLYILYCYHGLDITHVLHPHRTILYYYYMGRLEKCLNTLTLWPNGGHLSLSHSW